MDLNVNPPPAASGQPAPAESTQRRPRDFPVRLWRRIRRKAASGPAVPLTDDQARQARRVRIGSGIIMTALAAGAAVVSYNDGLFLVRLAGIGGRVAYLYPLLPDGLIIISWASAYEAGLAGLRYRPAWATAGIGLGALLTLAMNIGAGVLHNRLQALVDGVVPVVLFVALEILVGLIRRGHRGAAGPGDTEEWHCPHSVAMGIEEAVRTAYFHGRDCEGAAPKFIDLEASFGISRKRVAELVKAAATGAPEPSLNGAPA